MPAYNFNFTNHPFITGFRRRYSYYPSWVITTAVVAAVLVFVVPIVLLALAAVITFIAVFSLLGLIYALLSLPARLLHTLSGHSRTPGDTSGGGGASGGRINVRVIERP